MPSRDTVVARFSGDAREAWESLLRDHPGQSASWLLNHIVAGDCGPNCGSPVENLLKDLEKAQHRHDSISIDVAICVQTFIGALRRVRGETRSVQRITSAIDDSLLDHPATSVEVRAVRP